MKTLISNTIFAASLDAEFARIGIRASTFVVTVVRDACKVAGIKASTVSKEELRAHVDAAIAYLVSKGCPPADKDGTTYTAQRMAQFASECVRTAQGQVKKKATTPAQGQVKKKATTPAKLPIVSEGGEISAMVPTHSPSFDASARALQDAAKVPQARELATKLRNSKNADVAALAAFVLDFFV